MPLSLPTVANVRTLITTPMTDAQVQSLIDTAALIADKCISNFEAARQQAILTWLTAHLIASTSDNGVATSQALGDASVSYSRAALGDGLKATHYGQQVLLLDPTGCLARTGRAKASIEKI